MDESKLTLPSETKLQLDRRFKALGAEAMLKVRIYLDTNFWVLLRKQVIEQQTSTIAGSLLAALRKGVAEGKIVCTYSGHTLSEIMKHGDKGTQVTTAELMDELSQGYCLANQDRLLNNEIVYWLCGLMNPYKERHALAELAWAKPAYLVLDHLPPNIPGVGQEAQLAIHADFIERMWSMPMTQLMMHLQSYSEPYPALDWPKSAADSINSEVRNYDCENSTRDRMYLSELWGLVDWLGDTLLERYEEAATLWGKPVPKIQVERQQCKKVLQNAIMALARTRSISGDLPSIHIRTTVHTAIRWDKNRRFKANDFMDIEHTQTAIPTCNFFFTDAPNAHLIRSTKLDTMYDCITTGDPQEALQHVLEASQRR